MKKLFKLSKLHIYVFGVLSNIIPIIGLFVLEGINFEGLHQWQFWAWICGAIYYIFVWIVAVLAYNKLKKQNKSLEERIKALEQKLKTK